MRYVFLVFAALIFTFPAAAQTAGETVAETVFNEIEKRIIKEYFGKRRASRDDDDDDDRDDDDDDDDDDDRKGKKAKKNKGKKGKGGRGAGKGKSGKLPPGLAKRKNLPPGLARHLTEKGELPPGLARRDLPEDLASDLPAAKEGQKRLVVDRDVVLIEEATGRVLDVIIDVLKR